MQLLPDAIVRCRRSRWRIVDVRRVDDCSIVTMRGLSPPHLGVERQLLSPFDRFESVVRVTRPLRVAPRRWRRGCRAAIARDTPPGALRAAARAHIDLHAYQLAPALAVVRGLACRLLLADEVGLGKTIQAGLIVGELRARGTAGRVLVLTPAGLRDQWRSELRDRFDVTATFVDARSIRSTAATLPPAMNPWSTFDVAIASIDYVKRPDVLAAAAARPWDVVVVDEAHGAASDSDRRAAVDLLCASAAYVLLLTATPHSGDGDAFAALSRLGQAGDDRLVVFRRTRHDAGVDGRRLVRTLRIRQGPHERRMHAALRRYGDAVIAERPHAWLALSVLHKRALSSAAALAESVDRRLAELNDAIGPADAAQLALPLDEPGETTPADETPAWSSDLALTDADRERHLLTALAVAARAAAPRDSKLRALARLLGRVRESALVYTEYRDTLRHLQRAIPRPTIVLHGGMTRDERRTAVDAFTREPGAIMIATDAAGEGLNLQAACRLVVNLELPWNPMRLEQRIGRVDRIGQRRTVHAIHFVARNTGEVAILARLRARLAAARAAIGAPDPLGAGEERVAAELVVLRRRRVAPVATAAALADTRAGDLADDARAEAARLREARRLLRAGAPNGDVAARPLAMRARPALRRALRGRALEIWRVTADDACGRSVESGLVALLIDREHGDVAAALARAANRWCQTAEAVATAFASARLQRCVAIAARDAPQLRGPRQAALFADRRRAAEQLLTNAEHASRRLHLDARLDEARAAMAITFRSPELLFVVSQQWCQASAAV